jgi:hypothetical protein
MRSERRLRIGGSDRFPVPKISTAQHADTRRLFPRPRVMKSALIRNDLFAGVK